MRSKVISQYRYHFDIDIFRYIEISSHLINTTVDIRHLAMYFDAAHPEIFSSSVLLLPPIPIPDDNRHTLNILILYFLHTLHTRRLHTLSQD